MLVARKCDDLIADCDAATFDLSLESAEGMIRTAHTLYRHIESVLLLFLADIDILKIRKEHRSVIPVHLVGTLCDIIALRCRNRNDLHTRKRKLA